MFDFKVNVMPKDDKAIKALETRVLRAYTSKNARENLHLLLCAHVLHAIANKSADRLSNLFNALPNTANKQGIRIWVQEYTTLEFGKDAAGNPKFIGKDKLYGWKGKEHGGYTLGMVNPFYDMAKVKHAADKPFNFDDLIKAALDKAAKARKEGKLNEYDAMEAEAIAIAVAEFRKVAGVRPQNITPKTDPVAPAAAPAAAPAGTEVALAN